MSSELQIFANGRVSVLSTKLFGADKFVRLAECGGISEAVRLLADGGYGGGIVVNDANDYIEMLRNETEKLLAEFKELCTNDGARKFFLANYDFVNAKVLMKAKYMRIDGTKGCFAQASFDVDKMQADFVNDDYSAYPKQMAEGCDAADDRFARGQRMPSVVDEELDKAMFAYMKKCAASSGLRVVKQLCAFRIDATNVVTLARAKKAGFERERFEQLIVDGGKVKMDVLLRLWNEDNSVVSDLPDDVRKVYEAVCRNVADGEEVRRNKEFELLTSDPDTLSVAPVLVYFARKTHEIDLVRMILIGVKNNLDKDEIKRRIAL